MYFGTMQVFCGPPTNQRVLRSVFSTPSTRERRHPVLMSQQGHELQMATNCLGPFLFTTLLQPILKSTASSSPSSSVRVCWASSLESDTSSPKGGIVFDDSGAPVYRGTGQQYNYGMSKAGNVFYASEWAKQYPDDGVVSVCFNPGNLSTELQRHIQFPGVALAKIILEMVLLYPAIYGAYTELWSGLSDRVTIKDNGAYIAPWGQVGQVRADIAAGLKTKEEGGSGAAAKFWDWSVKETKQYLS
jgi:retinol dehydrogenase 12